MTRFAVWMLVLHMAQLAAAADDVAEIAGVWRVTTTFGSRAFVSMLRFENDGGDLKGVLIRRPGQQSELREVQFQDGKIRFATANRRRPDVLTRYTGELDGEIMRGKLELQLRGERREWDWVAERSDPEVLQGSDKSTPVAADIELAWNSYDAWRDHILPEQSELLWQQIPWHSTFKDGILAADSAQKPLLLWTMNGHPLGCT